MRLRILAAGLCSVTTVLAAGTVTVLTPPAEARSSATTLRVGSFNVSNVAFDSRAHGSHKRWKVRRPVIVSQIMSRRLDVVGLQEANQSSVYPRSMTYGRNQFMDLRWALRHRGGHYAVTNRAPYNCVRATSSQHCRYRYRGASQDTRILYNYRTLRLLRQGSVRFHHQTSGKQERYLAWAVFRSKRNGHTFFFANTHLDPYRPSVRRAQWGEVIRNVDRLKHGRRVVVVGDFNTSKFDRDAATYLPAMKRHGYGDVLNQSYRKPLVRSPRARSTVRAWLNSFNGFRPNARPYAYEESKRKTGNGIDWVFASNSMPVQKWEVVANLDRHYRVRGVIPSDHNLVRASLLL